MKVEKVSTFTRESVEQDSTNVYIFGDNFSDSKNLHIPTRTQAVIRGLPNAIGICTKNNRGTTKSSYLRDYQYEQVKQHIDKQLKKARKLSKELGGSIKISRYGIGTGAAMLANVAPKINEYLQNKLEQDIETW